MEFSANQIAEVVQGTVEGNGNVMVSTFAKIEEGHSGALSFLANMKYKHFIYETKSSIVLVGNDLELTDPVTATLIRVPDPYAAMATLMKLVAKYTMPAVKGIEQPCHISAGVDVDAESYVGAFSYIGKGVKLGHRVKIYPQVYIGDGAVIGDDAILYPGVKVYHGCKIGQRCVLHAGVVIGADGFGFAPMPDGSYSKIPQMGIVEVADDVEIGANTTVDRATMGSTKVGRGTKLDNLIQVAHNAEIGCDTVMAAQVGVAGSTKIGDNCMIGGQVGFAGHVHVGNHVVIGAQSGIPSNVKDGARLMGYPAVDYTQFLRQASYVKHLGDLNKRVDKIEKTIN